MKNATLFVLSVLLAVSCNSTSPWSNPKTKALLVGVGSSFEYDSEKLVNFLRDDDPGPGLKKVIRLCGAAATPARFYDELKPLIAELLIDRDKKLFLYICAPGATDPHGTRPGPYLKLTADANSNAQEVISLLALADQLELLQANQVLVLFDTRFDEPSSVQSGNGTNPLKDLPIAELTHTWWVTGDPTGAITSRTNDYFPNLLESALRGTSLDSLATALEWKDIIEAVNRQASQASKDNGRTLQPWWSGSPKGIPALLTVLNDPRS